MSRQTLIDSILARRQMGDVELPDDAAPRLAKLPGIRAVVFDVYGTLFSSGAGDISLASEENRDAALRATLREAGFTLHRSAAGLRLDRIFHGWIGTHQERRRAAGVVFPEVEIRAAWRDFLAELETSGHVEPPPVPADPEWLAVEFEGRVNPVQPMPGLEATLRDLRDRDIAIGIVSNGQFFTPLLFEAFLPGGFAGSGVDPDLCVWSCDLLEAKPSVKLFFRCAEALAARPGIGPNQALFVGNDLRNDIWPAQSAGFRTALFAGDRLSLRRRQDDPDCAGVRADLEVTALPQVPDCV
jgi:putative hydrolase of the HAD superfamily